MAIAARHSRTTGLTARKRHPGRILQINLEPAGYREQVEWKSVSIQSLSFWQQDQAFWSQAQSQAQASATSTALITAMGSAVSNEAKGLASIANKTALSRVNSQLTAALQSALQASQASSSTSSSDATIATTGAPAVGTGTVPLSSNTSLLTLGVISSGTITVSDGTNTTTYVSTGSDTVGDLVNAINNPNIATNAQVKASIDSGGHLVLTGGNNDVSISVGGLYASNIGFGPKNDSFQPTAPTASAASGSTSASSATSGTTGSTGTSSTAAASTPAASLFNSAYALQTGGTAEFLLASGGAGGTLLNLLA
jgi:Flagellin hook IN motif